MGVKNIQAAAYNGARTVYEVQKNNLEMISTQCGMAEDAVKLRDTSIASAD